MLKVGLEFLDFLVHLNINSLISFSKLDLDLQENRMRTTSNEVELNRAKEVKEEETC